MATVRTNRPLADELRRLLGERGVSLRSVAEAIDVNQSYLSRIMGKKGAAATRPASAKVAAAIADYFDLPIDYFVEYRHAVVLEAIARDKELRDRIYDSLISRPRGRSMGRRSSSARRARGGNA